MDSAGFLAIITLISTVMGNIVDMFDAVVLISDIPMTFLDIFCIMWIIGDVWYLYEEMRS